MMPALQMVGSACAMTTFQTSAVAAGEGRQRDLFPLPRMSSNSIRQSSHLSRGCAQRLGKKLFRENEIDHVCTVLNDIYSAGVCRSDLIPTSEQTPPLTLGQSLVREHVAEVLNSYPKAESQSKPHEASRALLGSCLAYHGAEASNHVRAYDRDLVSLPELGSQSPSAESLLDPASATVVREFESHMLLSGDEWETVLENEPPIVPYMDEVLSKDHLKYVKFVADLANAHVVKFTDSPFDIVTPFFVEKRGKKTFVLSLIAESRIVDSNRAHRWKWPEALLGPACLLNQIRSCL